MTRRIAGVFDPGGRGAGERLARALAGAGATQLDLGPLRVACGGPAPAAQTPLCLLDGFLDNAAELAAALGHRELFAGDDGAGACEGVLAAGYRRWGRELVARMRGDFVLLVWDEQRREGLIARDQLGVRCAYIHDSARGLHFANEIHELLAILPTRPQPDAASVAHWIAVSNRPGSHTMFAGVRRLEPGCMVLLNRDGVREHRYWTPRFVQPRTPAPARRAQLVRAGLADAVARRIQPGGLTGVLMSGGLDSACVAAVASELAPGGVSAYAGTFPDHPAVDESSLIAKLRESLELPGVTAEVRSGGLLASVLDSIAAWAAPPAAWGDFWTLPLLRAAAADGAGIVLGGDGGDELFAARAYVLADDVRAGRLRAAHAHALQLPGGDERPARRLVARVLAIRGLAGAAPFCLHDALSRPFVARSLPAWLSRDTARLVVKSDDPLAWKRLEGPRWWAHAAHGLTRGVEEAGVFEHHRRRAALGGVQARHPLFDLDLVELVLGLSPDASLDPHRNRPLLRESMAGRLPDSVRLRPGKAWFDSLIVDCLAGDDGAAVRCLLSDPRAELRAYVDQDVMRTALWDSARPGPVRSFAWMHQMWRLLTAECWLRSQAGDDVLARLPGGLVPAPGRVKLQRAPEAPGLLL